MKHVVVIMSTDIEDIVTGRKRPAKSVDGALPSKVIKTEPVDDESELASSEQDIAERIVLILQNYPDGLADKEMQSAMPAISVGVRAKAINILLGMKKIELFTKKRKDVKEVIYKLREDSQATGELKDANVKEQIVYEIIRQASNKGIWHRDIRIKSNLMIHEITKILKQLESKAVIKSVKYAKKKLYMLKDLDPDSSITNTGAWFDNEEYDSEFVQVVTQQCHRYLHQKSAAAQFCLNRNPLKFQELAAATPADICHYLQKLGLTKVELSPSDLEKLLDALVFEGEVEKRSECRVGSQVSSASEIFYLVNPRKTSTSSIHTSPCLRCPVARNCKSVGRISPSSCPYLSNIWNYCDTCVDEEHCTHLSSILPQK